MIVLLGVLSLGFWGGLAGHRARLTGWRLLASIAYGLLVGVLILGLQAILRPGQGNLRADQACRSVAGVVATPPSFPT